jgi:hypothetical protein
MAVERTIPEYLRIRAQTLEEAWGRFDPQTPLPVGSPFYVAREDNPLGRLERGLLLALGKPPKYFFAGHRGCGKSTELNRLVDSEKIRKKYWPVKFSVKDTSDFNDLNYIDVLLAIGAQIYDQYTTAGQRLDQDLLTELEQWKGSTIEQLTAKGAVFESGVGFDIGQFLLSALLKVKTEHTTRRTIRQVIEPRLTELIEIINLMSAEIQAQTGRQVLVVVEDMDKPPLPVARKLFAESFVNLTQPICAIVYTVPMSIYFDPTYTYIREGNYFLPSVKLHPKGQRTAWRNAGLKTMRHFVRARMAETLITEPALIEAAKMSGGLFREMGHVMQKAIDHALARDSALVTEEDVERAVAQIRSDFRRQLDDEAYRLLLDVRTSNELRRPDKLAPLFHNLAVLEYLNDESWCDVHPALNSLLDEIAPTLQPPDSPVEAENSA